jgi:hypothetical protein
MAHMADARVANGRAVKKRSGASRRATARARRVRRTAGNPVPAATNASETPNWPSDESRNIVRATGFPNIASLFRIRSLTVERLTARPARPAPEQAAVKTTMSAKANDTKRHDERVAPNGWAFSGAPSERSERHVPACS